MALGIVEAAELRRGLPQAGVGSENAAAALTLVADLDARETQVSTVLIVPQVFAIISSSIGRSPGVEGSVLNRVEEFGKAGITRGTYDATHLALPTLRSWK
jgi:hypothetical protein